MSIGRSTLPFGRLTLSIGRSTGSLGRFTLSIGHSYKTLARSTDEMDRSIDWFVRPTQILDRSIDGSIACASGIRVLDGNRSKTRVFHIQFIPNFPELSFRMFGMFFYVRNTKNRHFFVPENLKFSLT